MKRLVILALTCILLLAACQKPNNSIFKPLSKEEKEALLKERYKQYLLFSFESREKEVAVSSELLNIRAYITPPEIFFSPESHVDMVIVPEQTTAVLGKHFSLPHDLYAKQHKDGGNGWLSIDLNPAEITQELDLTFCVSLAELSLGEGLLEQYAQEKDFSKHFDTITFRLIPTPSN